MPFPFVCSLISEGSGGGVWEGVGGSIFLKSSGWRGGFQTRSFVGVVFRRWCLWSVLLQWGNLGSAFGSSFCFVFLGGQLRDVVIGENRSDRFGEVCLRTFLFILRRVAFVRG